MPKMAKRAAAGASNSERLVRLIHEEYEREQRSAYGGLSALCQAACNLPIYPNLSKRDDKISGWKKEVTEILTMKNSPGALRLNELKQKIRAERGVGAVQKKSVTAVELMSHIPELLSILKLYLKNFIERHPNFLKICLKIFIFILLNVVLNSIIPIGSAFTALLGVPQCTDEELHVPKNVIRLHHK